MSDAPVTDVADRYRRLSQQMADRIARVPADAWSSPTPCEEWTARELVGHLVESQGLFLGMVERPFETTISVDDDPAGAWNEARAQVQADLDDPERATAPFEGFQGPSTLEQGIDRFVCFDLVVHGWDLARAVGLDETMDPDEIVRLAAQTDAFGDILRTSGACGPEVPVDANADPQTRLLGRLGRAA